MSPVYVFEEMRLPMELLACLLVFLVPFAEKRPHFKERAVIGFLALTLFSLLFFPIFLDKETPRLEYLSVFWYGIIALSAYAYGRFCFVIGRCDALYFSISAFLTQNIIYCVYHCFLARILLPGLREALPLYVCGAALFTLLVCLPVRHFFRPSLVRTGGKLMEEGKTTFLILSGMFLLMLVFLFFYQGAFAERVSVFDTLAWLSGVVICLFFLIIQYSILRGVLNIREKATLESMLRSSERYYEMSKEHIAIINRKCHDLKHQLKALERAGEEDRSEYIREAQESINFYQALVYTDNEALNTILAEKGLFCQEKEITFRCAADDADLSFIRLPDLYALLGNAIDNAIEYVEQQKDPAMRAISVRIEKRGMFVGIQVLNPYAGEPITPGQLPQSHKEDSANHGFGMRSIRFLAEKYGGTMEFSTADGLFTLQILLPAP